MYHLQLSYIVKSHEIPSTVPRWPGILLQAKSSEPSQRRLGIIPNGFHVRSVQNLWIYTHNLKYTPGTSFFLDSPFEKSVDWNIMKSWSTCNTWDLDILGGEGLPRSQEIIRSHQDSNLSMSPYQVMFGLALAIHQPVVGLTKRIAVWCTWPWLLLQSPWDLRFAETSSSWLLFLWDPHCPPHQTQGSPPHIETMRSITNTDHPRDLLLQPYPKVAVFTTKATHPQIFEGLAQTHQLMLDGTSAHSPASYAGHVNATRGTSALLRIAEIPSYLKFCTSGED